ncbi:hypothetical protein PTSG_12836 [Salpingoeca rosetta]|uniref:Prolyl endopeptidase n=1 Tax=Salpingoeca rosetta (strain ATCC 50818 / BSB-021) TaxID=946362 RepID=F2UM62_SALR5|nr:uncharacterized protein PTSG_12836 [Salpingoeca rosetta]EGD78211.1 hypothetical protein PTSG_12836 [Salpingoeca rosetta]|eukprot:XP_004989887.1 hypothetical protein PTSG_12836 [Salpingoeca rosetta]
MLLRRGVQLSLCAAAAAVHMSAGSPINPNFPAYKGPRAARKPHAITVHGDKRIDYYYWLRDDDRKDSDVLGLCKAENEHMMESMAGTEELQKTLVAEMRSRIKEDDTSLPTRKKGFYYYSRTLENQQYPVVCRRRMRPEFRDVYSPEDTMDDTSCQAEEVLLDENADAKGKDYYVVRGIRPSPSHRYIAFGKDTNGSELYTIHFLDTQAKDSKAQPTYIKDSIPNTTGGVIWVGDSHVVYTTRDETKRPDKVWLHEVGGSGDDVLLYHESDPEFAVGAWLSRTERYVYISSSSAITSEVLVAPAHVNAAGTLDITSVMGRTKGVEYSVDDRGDMFFVVTNSNDAVNNRLIALKNVNPADKHEANTPLSKREGATTEELIGHRPHIKLEDVTLYRQHMVVSERRDGLPVISLHTFADDDDGHGDDGKRDTNSSSGGAGGAGVFKGDAVTVAMPEEAYVLWERGAEYNSNVLRYGYTSMTTPLSTFDLDMNSPHAQPVLKKQEPVLGGFDPSAYVSRRVYARSHDGTRVPISIVHRKDIGHGPHPTVLEGYGAYEISNDCYFSRNVLSLLDRGVVYAIAHVRGGGEMGRMWYEHGKYLHKKNTWLDFHACAQSLIDDKIADPDRLVAEGRSAGGLLIGAALNTAPKRSDGKPFYTAAFAGVPFVDVLTTMLDESIPLTAGEWEEWGDPRRPEYYEYMKSYSPVDNVAPENGPYPPIFIQAGLHDPRVQYWEPLKYAQVLRDAGAPSVICKIDMAAGHFSSSGRFDRLKDEALVYAFMLRALGLEDAQPKK